MSEKKAALVLDDWKLPFFEKALKEAGYTYEVMGSGITKDTKMVRIPYTQDQFRHLERVLRAAAAEADRSRAH